MIGLIVSLVLVTGLSGTAIAGPMEDGFAAYESGDFDTALGIFGPLASGGNARAQSSLGLMFANGEGVLENDVEAVRWFRMAADQGSPHGQANLSVMYAKGEGVPENDTEAVKWSRMAADQGYARAQSNIALMYANGEGVPADNVQAYRWWNLAAAQGDAEAQKNKGILEQKMTREEIAEAQRLSAEKVVVCGPGTVSVLMQNLGLGQDG